MESNDAPAMTPAQQQAMEDKKKAQAAAAQAASAKQIEKERQEREKAKAARMEKEAKAIELQKRMEKEERARMLEEQALARGGFWTPFPHTSIPKPAKVQLGSIGAAVTAYDKPMSTRATEQIERGALFLDDNVCIPTKVFFTRAFSKPAPCVIFFGGLLFVAAISSVILLGVLQPRCSSKDLPCRMDGNDGCLCAVRGADGSCWLRAQPALKCFKVAHRIQSGVCQGLYMGGYCAKDLASVNDAVAKLTESFLSLHPNIAGRCNMTFASADQRCSLPKTRQDSREFDFEDCCRIPMQQCMTDSDCCDCGTSSPDCEPPIRCRVTTTTPNGTVYKSQDCEREQDACLSYSYAGCRGTDEDCLTDKEVIPYADKLGNILSPSADPSCCAKKTCNCRSQCATENYLKGWSGCPCHQTSDGCHVKQCLQSSKYFGEGGILYKLEQLGATDVRVCYTDNCNDDL